MCFRRDAYITPPLGRRNGTRVVVPACGAAVIRTILTIGCLCRLRYGSGSLGLGFRFRLSLRGAAVRFVVGTGKAIPVQYSSAVELALDGDEGMEELVGDVGEDGGATGGDAVLHDEDQELGQELIDLIGGLEVVELDQEVGGKVDVNGLRRLDLQRA